MFDATKFDLALFEASAAKAATLLRLLGNERRLTILCQLADGGERSVGQPAGEEAVDAPAVPREQLAERRLISRLIGRHENLVAGGLGHASSFGQYGARGNA